MADEIYDPLKSYESQFKTQIVEEAEKFFDELAEQAGTDVEANRETIRVLRKLEGELKGLQSQSNKKKALKGFLIFLIVLLFAATGILTILMIQKIMPLWGIAIAVATLVLGIVLIVVIAKKINPVIKNLQKLINEKMAEIEEQKKIAEAQMASLIALYDWNMPSKVIMKVTPIIELDQFLDGRRYNSLVTTYGFPLDNDKDSSTLVVQSGTVLGNPFVLQDAKLHRIINKVYTGSLTISWTESYYDSQGNYQTRTRTQVLTASITRPAPEYSRHTTLIYGNPAAPDLSFSRAPQGMSGKSEKEIKKWAAKMYKEFKKLGEQSTRKGGNLTPLANDVFESLFHAWDRDHEQQFRLLFTPLAQQSETNLLSGTGGYGDDFYFTKKRMINFISSSHSQRIDYSGDPRKYISIEFDEAKRLFVNHTAEFFKGFYFDMAPLLSIPLYQQMKSLEYIYGKDAPDTNYAFYEHEALANAFQSKFFVHPDTTTDCILKTRVSRSDGLADKVIVSAYSYQGVERVEYVPKMGGDGYWHDVPVYWIEYIPLYNETVMEVRDTGLSRPEFNGEMKHNFLNDFICRYSNDGYYAYQRHLLALLETGNYNYNADNQIGSYLKKVIDRLNGVESSEEEIPIIPPRNKNEGKW